ncbi:MAG: hypothetical protein U5K69_03155 [Balneolaceae bacterium]|nr:hypothetical protein [Balneolaceae bacterium]
MEIERNNIDMEEAVKHLKANLRYVARVYEWANLMGYENPKRFSEKFLNYFGIRPQKIMELIRLESIICDLRSTECYSNMYVARKHSLPDEKTLNNFTNYHAGHSPTGFKNMSEEEVTGLIESLWNKTLEEYGAQSSTNADELSSWQI